MINVFETSPGHHFMESPGHQRNVGTSLPPPPPGELGAWQVFALHKCSGFPPHISWEIHSASDEGNNPVDPEGYTEDPWISNVRSNVCYTSMGEGTVQSELRDAVSRYLVTTLIGTLVVHTGGTTNPWYQLTVVKKRHKHTNELVYEDWCERRLVDGSSSFSTLYHWDIDDEGTVTTSGVAAYASIGDWAYAAIIWPDYSTISDPPGPAAYGVTAPINDHRNGTVASASVTYSEDIRWSNTPGSVYASIAVSYTLSNEESNPWSVALAEVACRELSALGDLMNGAKLYYEGAGALVAVADYPPTPDTSFTSMTTLGGPPYTCECLSIQWGGPVEIGGTRYPLQVMYHFTTSTNGYGDPGPTPPTWWDGSAVYPNAVADAMPVSENYLSTGFYANQSTPGSVLQLKTLVGLKAGTFKVRTRAETPSAPSTDGWGVGSLGSDNGAEETVASTVDASNMVLAVPAQLYYAVPTPWQGREVICVSIP